MAKNDMALMAHLMRRAGFGATREELEGYVAQGYEATVEWLLHPEKQPDWDEDLYTRIYPECQDLTALPANQIMWVYRMINTKRPLQEKIALFWHGLLVTGDAKVNMGPTTRKHLEMYRRCGLGSYRDLLMEISTDPSMLYFLDNVESHKGTVNENYGRELLELFSIGVGMDGNINYTEDDVKACSRAFTGWNIAPTIGYGGIPWEFQYDPADHDDEEKTFLGETGRWNGEDIVDILVRQPSTARFISRHLYDFFVADEAEVPAWKDTPPRDMEAVVILEKAFVESNYDMREVMRVLFNSEFFKESRFQKIKSPAEVVVGTLRLVGDFTQPKPGLFDIAMEVNYMGQELGNPPTVEGWHTGKEWINSGTLVDRTNFVTGQLERIDQPGVRDIVDRVMARGDAVTPEGLVEGCLDMLGSVEVTEKTRNSLLEHAKSGGPLSRETEDERAKFARRVGQMLQMISASAEYQYG